LPPALIYSRPAHRLKISKHDSTQTFTLAKSKGWGGNLAMQLKRSQTFTAALALAPLVSLAVAEAATVTNPLCPGESVLFNPDQGQDIVVPAGFKVSVFATGLNAPTGIAFTGNSQSFRVWVLESGHGLPSVCNDQSAFGSGDFDPNNPFTPDILVFDQNGTKIAGPLAKPNGTGTTQTGGLQAEGPAIDIAFVNGLSGGRLFATDSNQSLRTQQADFPHCALGQAPQGITTAHVSSS
jgi:hypothetical protein